jgi:hypothetical protein
MEKMNMDCHDKSSDTECCESSSLEIIPHFINSSNQNKILKIKLISFIDIFNVSSKFLENRKLIKNTSPPDYNFLKKDIKNYTSLTGIIKNNC